MNTFLTTFELDDLALAPVPRGSENRFWPKLAAPLRQTTGHPILIDAKRGSPAPLKNGILLTAKNADTNLGPEGCELVYQLQDHSVQPRAIGGFVPLEDIYSLDPIPADLAAKFQSHILGAQANLRTESVSSLPHAEYLIFPRLCALSEVVGEGQLNNP